MHSIFEERQEKRYSFFKPVEVAWIEADGTQRQATGTSIDISLYGLLVEVSEAVPLRAALSVKIQGMELSSKATARHCQEALAWFRVGLQFERTLLAEHIGSLDAVLIHSLRCASLNTAAVQATSAKPWRQRLHDVARFMHIEPNSLSFVPKESTNGRPALLNQGLHASAN